MRILARSSLPALLVLLAGCGQGNFFGSSSALDQTPSTGTPYHAYGDSITYGYGLAHPATQAYPAVFASANTLALSNYAISGDMSCDVPTRQIFPHADQPTTGQKLLYSLVISTNDIGYKGVGSYEAVFNTCQQASIAWLALPVQYKTLATQAVVHGASHMETANNWNAIYTDAAGATVTFTFTRAVPGPAYLWYRIVDGNSGTFTYALDGQQPLPLTTSTTPRVDTNNGSNNSLALLRLAAVPAGTHSLILTQTSASPSGMGVVALGLPPVTAFAGQPRVLVGTTPPQNLNGSSQCVPNPIPCQVYAADITANAKLLASDGLDVELFTPGKYMSATYADFIDSFHPNALGHQEIAHALQDVY